MASLQECQWGSSSHPTRMPTVPTCPLSILALQLGQSLGSEPLTHGLSFYFLLPPCPPCPSSYPVGLVPLPCFSAMEEKPGANQESPNTPLSFQLSSPASPMPLGLQCTKPQVKSEQELREVLHVADHAQRTFLVQSVGQSEVRACW